MRFAFLSRLRDDRGVSAVEFAMIAPVLLTILMGVMEFSMILYTFNAAENAARDTTRQLATNRITSAQASNAAKQQLPTWVAANASVTVSQTAPSDPSTNQFTLDISFPASAATPTNFLSATYASLVLHSKVTMQQEVAP